MSHRLRFIFEKADCVDLTYNAITRHLVSVAPFERVQRVSPSRLVVDFFVVSPAHLLIVVSNRPLIPASRKLLTVLLFLIWIVSQYCKLFSYPATLSLNAVKMMLSVALGERPFVFVCQITVFAFGVRCEFRLSTLRHPGTSILHKPY